MRLSPLPLIFIFLLFSLSVAQGQTIDFSKSDTTARMQAVEKNLYALKRSEDEGAWTLQDRMRHYKVKGVSIAVIHNYQLDWAKGYGLADEERKTPVTAETVFQAASISKSLNAVGVLKLVQEHKLNINADIDNYLAGGKGLPQGAYTIAGNWKFPYDSLSKGKKITMANLLSHTAGLTVHGFEGYEKGTDIPAIAQVLDGLPPANSKPVRSMYEPGLKYEYSGGGITISQLMVMNITHEPYEKYMAENVLIPLEMTSSTYSQFAPRDRRKFYATGYREDGKEIPEKYHIYPEQAAAGLWTNPTDLSKYIIETQLAYEGKSAKVLNQQMTEVRLTPYIDKKAAMGVFVEELDSTKYFEHEGANEGFRSMYYGSLEGGNGVVVMVNSDNGNIIPEIVNSVAKVYGFKGLFHSDVIKVVQVKVASNLLQAYVGKYEIDPDNILTVTLDGTQLYGEVKGRSRFGLFPESDTKFSAKAIDVGFEFVRDDKGNVLKTVINEGGVPHDARKIK